MTTNHVLRGLQCVCPSASIGTVFPSRNDVRRPFPEDSVSRDVDEHIRLEMERDASAMPADRAVLLLVEMQRLIHEDRCAVCGECLHQRKICPDCGAKQH